jgi:hypothetical protein
MVLGSSPAWPSPKHKQNEKEKTAKKKLKFIAWEEDNAEDS